jgi:hypothetical protein
MSFSPPAGTVKFMFYSLAGTVTFTLQSPAGIITFISHSPAGTVTFMSHLPAGAEYGKDKYISDITRNKIRNFVLVIQFLLFIPQI